VNPLLVNFDFRGICGRSIDSNSYSIWQAGQELALQYNLRIEQQGDNLVLLGQPLDGMGSDPILVLGRSHGIEPGGFNKIFLEPGWRLPRRTYHGNPTGHIYLTSDFQDTGIATSADRSPSSTIRATPVTHR
jgi:N-acetylmuramoyl-L-alanine amidase